MTNEEILKWLLKGDVSIQYQTNRDLLDIKKTDLQERIELEGWGAKFLSKRKLDGHWGDRFYQPKWISTHYTLLDLKNLNILPQNEVILHAILKILKYEKAIDGGVGPFGKEKLSDACVDGMFLNYASYFKAPEDQLRSVIDCILALHLPDGGFNCFSNRSTVHHSSLHSTLSMLEGLEEYLLNGYKYRRKDVEYVRKAGIEFILKHQLFISDRTGLIIKKSFLKLTFPGRWYYDILRALDYFQHANVDWDDRMQPAIDVLMKKRNKDGTWNVQAKHPGQLHFEMEKAGKPSRWNTLRALRVLSHFNKEY